MAISIRVDWCSKGRAATAKTMAPDCRACLANSCAAPVPTPPPRPVRRITSSVELSIWLVRVLRPRMRCSASGGSAAQPTLSRACPSRNTWTSSPVVKLESSASMRTRCALPRHFTCACLAHEQPMPPTPATRMLEESMPLTGCCISMNFGVGQSST